MALSNWDCLAFDIHGPNVAGSCTNHAGITLEIYKNWLNVHTTTTTGVFRQRNEEAQVGRIDAGYLTIGDWSIRASRGPQDGIYVIAHSARYAVDDTVDGDHWHDKAIFAACGVYGYETYIDEHSETAHKLGVDDLFVISDGSSRKLQGYDADGNTVVVAEHLREPTYVGVLPSSVEHLRDLITDAGHDSSSWYDQALAAIAWPRALRQNQGDQFFQGAATAPGAAQPPIFDQLVSPETS